MLIIQSLGSHLNCFCCLSVDLRFIFREQYKETQTNQLFLFYEVNEYGLPDKSFTVFVLYAMLLWYFTIKIEKIVVGRNINKNRVSLTLSTVISLKCMSVSRKKKGCAYLCFRKVRFIENLK